MKRSDLPLFTVVKMPAKDGFSPGDVLLVRGSARDTCAFSVVEMPNGLPAEIPDTVRLHRATPMVALLIPASQVERISWDALREIGEAERLEAAGPPSAHSVEPSGDVT